jgi:hypothetical protein
MISLAIETIYKLSILESALKYCKLKKLKFFNFSLIGVSKKAKYFRACDISLSLYYQLGI